MLNRVIGILMLTTLSAAGAAVPPSAPAYAVHLEKTWIPMKDGVRLAVTLYMPVPLKPGERFPSLLEYLPYRKDDDEAVRDFGTHMYFARRGYVGARVDIRGFGASQGVPPDREYSAQEQQDAEGVIAWLARQSWSNGKVGMLGISWGGFNSIQMALRKPPALKAILAVAATEELFKEDVHYMDGVFHVDEFELTMDLDQGRPGAPDFSLDEQVIGPRMESPPWSLNYMKHQRDGEFWRAPLRPIETLEIPAFLIGGMQDGYRDSIPRMLERVKAPLKAWIGPWNHGFPNGSDYGPLYEWRDQAVRWFDYWLKGRETGVLKDPRVVIYQQHWHPPEPQPQNVPGEWRAETWPPAGLAPMTLYLQPDHRLSPAAAAGGRDLLRFVPSAGVEAGFWWGELLTDQRPVDAFSLTYDSEVLSDEVAILGLPRVSLHVAADVRLADWFVRLSDVAPDGRVTMITGGGINGAQRDSMAKPQDLVPDEIYALSVDLHLASWVFPKGHRIRVAISNALWPMNWPTPYPMTTSLMLGGDAASRVVLPRVPVHGPAAPAFAAPEPVEEPPGIEGVGGGGAAWPGEWTVLRDEGKQRSTVIWKGATAVSYPWGRFDHSEKLTYDIDDAHPDVARVQGDSEYIQAVKAHVLTWRGRLDVSSDAQTFFYKYTRTLLRDGVIIRTKTWEEPIPRDHQ
ncbi:MAG TPA: CocE/NonD family hydrolase [Steroidobacteraceae bacterium]|nr:CocE/NonD family hydrolase [Steroidobacteraceae bacterium]